MLNDVELIKNAFNVYITSLPSVNDDITIDDTVVAFDKAMFALMDSSAFPNLISNKIRIAFARVINNKVMPFLDIESTDIKDISINDEEIEHILHNVEAYLKAQSKTCF